MGNLAHGIGGIHGAVLAFDDHALKDLDALLAAFDDPNMDFDGSRRDGSPGDPAASVPN